MENVLNFTNIDNEDFVGKYGGEEIPVREGETKAFTETIANHIADQLVTKILIREGKDYLSDPKREVLLKQMIGEVRAPIVAAEEEKEKPEEAKKPEEEEFKELKTRKAAKRKAKK